MKPCPGADASGNFFRATEFANNAKRLGLPVIELLYELTHPPIRCWYRPTKTVPGPETMTKSSTIRSVETLSCDAGWRNYHFVKITTEDGIRDWSVTGVQTCALPIFALVMGPRGSVMGALSHLRIVEIGRASCRERV